VDVERQAGARRLAALAAFAEDKRQPSDLRAIAWQAHRMRLREVKAERRGRGWTVALAVVVFVALFAAGSVGWAVGLGLVVVVVGAGVTVARARVHGRAAEAAELRLQARRGEAV
jgi:hypothetical protein